MKLYTRQDFNEMCITKSGMLMVEHKLSHRLVLIPKKESNHYFTSKSFVIEKKDWKKSFQTSVPLLIAKFIVDSVEL